MFRFSHFYGIKVITESCFPIFPNQKKITIRDTNKWLYSSNFSKVTDRKKFLPLYSFTLSSRGREENIVPHPVSFSTVVFQPVKLWNSFYMTFPLYWTCDQKIFFDPHWLVWWWTSTIVIYHGIVNSLLHHLSLGNWM